MENKENTKITAMENTNEVNNKFFSEYAPIDSSMTVCATHPGLSKQPDATLIFG